jgi:hypothetical protein
MLFAAALAALILIACSSAQQGTSSTSSQSNDTKPVRIGLYKGSDSDQAPWWCDKEHTTIDWEAEKRTKKIPTEYIVIHHTSGIAGRSWQELSALQRERLYVKRFKPSIPDPTIPATVAVQSGHFRQLTDGPDKGKWTEVFYAYHWLIRKDGTAERLLNDDEVGWDSGNWDMNMRSVSICFDGDYTDTAPSDAQLKVAAKLIADYQKKFTIKDVVGHRDVKATICPGNWWSNGGKQKLMNLVKG